MRQAPRRRRDVRALRVLALCSVGSVAQAHGFGQRYDLPLPFWLYLIGAGSAVALSFVLYALFMRGHERAGSYPRANLLRFGIGRVLAHRSVRLVVRSAALAVFAGVVVAGLFGNQSPLKNIAPVMVWAVWWVGVPYVSALAGNAWALLNPIDTVYLACRRVRQWSGGTASSPGAYPPALAAWPAVIVLLATEWAELVWEDSDQPRHVATALLAYALVTLIAMRTFGRERWLAQGDGFSVVFGLLSRFAPTEVRAGGVRLGEASGALAPAGRTAEYGTFDRTPPRDREFNLRPYAVGLIVDEPVHPSVLVLVIVMLAGVTFDGFIETAAWTDLVARLTVAPDQGRTRIYTGALVLFIGVFVAVYFAFCWLMGAAAGTRGRLPVSTIARHFVLTLLPIAIAYHIAHYFSFLLLAGQYLVPLVSDPAGVGWDLFGTKLYFVRPVIVDARIVWYTSVAAIVIGHIAAVYLAHATALRVFGARGSALRSELPMLVLMIGYTMVSLSIIAQPITNMR